LRYVTTPPSEQRIVLIRSQKEKRRKELERERKEKEAEEAAKKVKEATKEEDPKPNGSTTATHVRTEVIPVPPPSTQESSSDDGDDNDENVPPAAGSSSWINVDESSPSTPSSDSTA
jgi:sRNA-binding protein